MSKLGKLYFLFTGISLVSFVLVRFLVGGWIPFLWICLGMVGIFLGLAFWKERQFLTDFFTMKTTRQGMSMGGVIVVVFSLLAAINFLAVRKYKTFDFSVAQVNTLSEQSIKLLGTLKEELRVLYFYQKGGEGVEENRHAFIEILKKYQDQSALVKLEFVDVNERPDLTEAYGVTKSNGVVFIDYKGRKSQIQKIDEQEITSALVKVTREKDKTIYFTVGHAERDLDNDKEAEGAGFLKRLLEGSRYIVKSLNLSQIPEVPTDADVLFIVGPQQGFLETEARAIDSYLKKGGAVVAALDPKAKHGLGSFLEKYGIVLKDNYLVNFMETPLGKAINPQVTVGAIFPSNHQITHPFGKSQFVVFRLPQEVGLREKMPEGLKGETLVKTSEQTVAFISTDFKGAGKGGSFSLVQLVSDGKMNLIVLGDSHVLNNQLLYQNLNRDLVLNTVASMVKEENLVSISPKEVGVTKMMITPTDFTLFVLGFIILVPIVFLGTSVTLWFKRRHA